MSFSKCKNRKEQINVSAQKKAILWQKIIKNKILNQAFVLKKHNKIEQSNELINLAKKVSLNDSKNIEAVAAALYFKTLFGTSFSRDELIDQLEYEGFTAEQAEYGVTAVGY